MRARLTYANVVATLALFVALTGAGAYAAGELAPSSVGERQLRKGAVTASKIRRDSVTATKIKSLAIKVGKLANGAVTQPKLAAGSVSSDKLTPAAVKRDQIATDAVTGENVVESTLSQVPSAAKADVASAAESANPMAFAAVDSEGVVISQLSKGVSNADVSRKSVGVYCIWVPGLNARGAQVTPRNEGDGNISAFATVGGTEQCPAPGVEVRTYKGVLTSEPFYISLYR
jgi:hypothetical protein